MRCSAGLAASADGSRCLRRLHSAPHLSAASAEDSVPRWLRAVRAPLALLEGSAKFFSAPSQEARAEPTTDDRVEAQAMGEAQRAAMRQRVEEDVARVQALESACAEMQREHEAEQRQLARAVQRYTI